MEPHIYKYRFGRSAYYGAAVYLALFGLLGWWLYHLYEGGYLSAWFTSFIGAIIALMALSIPRKIVVTEDRVEIRCLLDITEVRRDEIASVRRVEPRRMKWFIPIFGGYGFFGYYGHFLDLRRFDRVRLYASEWLRLLHGRRPARGRTDPAGRKPPRRRGRRRGGRGAHGAGNRNGTGGIRQGIRSMPDRA